MRKSKFQLLNQPTVTKNIFIINSGFKFNGKLPLELDSNINILKLNEKENICIVTLNLNIFKNKKDENVPFKQELEIQGNFTWDKSISREELEGLIKENASAILYSYLRPIITMNTVNANLPPLVIPVMNFSSKNSISEYIDLFFNLEEV